MTIYNFSAGPATLPKPVLEKAQAELLKLSRFRYVRARNVPPFSRI